MGFNVKKYSDTEFEPQEYFYKFPDLKDFFDEGDDPGFLLRGLSGLEYYQCDTFSETNKQITELAEKLLTGKSQEIADAITKKLGLGVEIPEIMKKRLSFFVYGVKEPKADLELAKLVCKRHPIEFTEITDKIWEMTGGGFHEKVKKKSIDSGGEEKSETP